MKKRWYFLTGGALLLVGLAAWFVYELWPVRLVHAMQAECPIELPADATDVMYCHPGAFAPFITANFQTSEASFHAWVKATGSRTMAMDTGDVSGQFFDVLTERGREVRTVDGIRYQWTEADRSETFLYDRSTGRAYWQHNMR